MKNIFNQKGFSLMGILIASVIGIGIITTLSKTIIHFTERASSEARRKNVSDIIYNLKTVIKSTQAWEATISNNASICVPGKQNCNNMIFYYSEKPFNNQSDYNSSSRQWTINHLQQGRHIGVAYFDIKGNLKYPGNCGDPTILTPSDIENCYKNDQLVKIEIYPPLNRIPMSFVKPPIPDFIIAYTDLLGTKTIQRTTLYQDLNVSPNPFDVLTVEQTGLVSCPIDTHIINCSISIINTEYLSGHIIRMNKKNNSCRVPAGRTAVATCVKLDDLHF